MSDLVGPFTLPHSVVLVDGLVGQGRQLSAPIDAVEEVMAHPFAGTHYYAAVERWTSLAAANPSEYSVSSALAKTSTIQWAFILGHGNSNYTTNFVPI